MMQRRNFWSMSVVFALVTAGCTVPLEPDSAELSVQARRGGGHHGGGHGNHGRIARLRDQIDQFGVEVLPPPPTPSPELYALGQALAFDPILSGNRDIACLTCHHPTLGSDDNRPLPLGTGASGLGMDRSGPGLIVPRNAPELFNRHGFDNMFWDSRVRIDEQGRFVTPAASQLTPEMEQVLYDGYGALGAQAMFPVTSRTEMRGQLGQSELGDIPDMQFTLIWNALMARLGDIPEYVTMFEAAYPGTDFEDMNFAHAGNAIGAFEAQSFYFMGSPFMQFVAGDDSAMTAEQIEGAIDYFDAGCGNCHGGPMLSDARHHNTGVPQIGTGTRGGPTNNDDFGFVLTSGSPRDRYAFRSPSLHNVELTGPWGHAGQFGDLRTYAEHYIDIEDALRTWDPYDQVIDPALRNTQYDNIDEVLSTLSPGVAGGVPAHLISDEMMVFFGALTDPAAEDLSAFVPATVPSGLPPGGI
ncbi:MAG: hypothetical protein H6737_31915 [Alphaproteobacteria bacterium]|nr:hypothetical protein [Alphaproteobacteria bacterium]